MIEFTKTTWHRESYDRLLTERLPELLAERLPLSGYSAVFTSETAATVVISITAPAGEISTEHHLPRPDEDGLFWFPNSIDSSDTAARFNAAVVIPFADNENLAVAKIACVGERVLDYIDKNLGQSTDGLPWDENLLRSWVPLDTWIADFLAINAQRLDNTNWLAARVHMRRLVTPDATGDLTSANLGLVSPLETPEGPNVNRVFSIAAGAEVREGRLTAVDNRPEAGFGISALMIPFIEHSSDARLIMSCNMMRQWLPQASPEPALVQTGCEPDSPEFWCGRNLLTAYIPWGGTTFEDAVIISESAARRFPSDAPIGRDSYHPIEPGDWLSNRHGAKCTIGRIFPDNEMPHLDGIPVDLVYSPSGVVSRLNLGQLWEASASRIARGTGEPLVAAPFHGPSRDDLQRRFVELGLPEDGLASLTDGKDGQKLELSSCVGWVYWGRLDQQPADRLCYSTGAELSASVVPGFAQPQGYLEYAALRDIGAFELLREQFGLRSIRHPKAENLTSTIAVDGTALFEPPMPAFAALVERLAAAGIRATVEDERLAFSLTPPADALTLARPVAHPWLRDVLVDAVGRVDSVPEYSDVEQMDTRLRRLIRSKAPETLIAKGVAALEAAVADYFDALVGPAQLWWSEKVVFSGKAVASPAEDLALDQVELPEEIAWGLFAPIVQREMADAEAVAARTDDARRILDAVMRERRVLLASAGIYAQPEHVRTPFLALSPVCGTGSVIRVHPGVTGLMNVDFDGDLLSVFLPVTEAGQREARELLTPQAYFERDPELLQALRPSMDAMWGLARLSVSEDGRRELREVGLETDGLLDRSAVSAALRRILEEGGVGAVIAAADRMRRRGLEAAKRSGWSIGPFLGHSLPLPPALASEDLWPRYVEEVMDILERKQTFYDNDTDPLRLSILSGARGTFSQLLVYLIGWGEIETVDAGPLPARHGLVEGISPMESAHLALGLRRRWYRNIKREMSLGSPINRYAAYGPLAPVPPANVAGSHVLARAMRAEYPGAVFARAAAIGEADPLTQLDSRLFVGLLPR